MYGRLPCTNFGHPAQTSDTLPKLRTPCPNLGHLQDLILDEDEVIVSKVILFGFFFISKSKGAENCVH